MITRVFMSLLVCFGLAVSTVTLAKSQQYIVLLKGNVKSKITQQLNIKTNADFNFLANINGFVANLSDNQLKALKADGRVKSVELDRVIALPSDLDKSVTKSSVENWGLDRLDQSQLPLDNRYQPWGDASGVNAYVIGTGIRTSHQEFGERANWRFTAPDITDGNDDGHGHGTHLAAIVGGSSFGVAKNVELHSVKVLDAQGKGSLTGLIAGINYVASHHQKPAVAVIGVSTGYSEALNSAIAEASEAGVSFALPSGDDNRLACDYSPSSAAASVAGVVSVAASAIDDSASNSANTGSCVDMYAPGLYVKSAWHLGDHFNNTISHSPVAAAHVAGALALIRGNDAACNVVQVKNQLLSYSQNNRLSGVPLGTANRLLGVPTSAPSGQSCSDINTQETETIWYPAAMVCTRALVDGVTPNQSPNYRFSEDLSIGRNSLYVRQASTIECHLPYQSGRYIKKVSLNVSVEPFNLPIGNCSVFSQQSGERQAHGTALKVEESITFEFSKVDLGVLDSGSSLIFSCDTVNTSTEQRFGYTRFWRADIEYINLNSG